MILYFWVYLKKPRPHLNEARWASASMQMRTRHRNDTNRIRAISELAEAEQTLSVSSRYFEEKEFAIRFNTASFDASANEESYFP